MKGAARLVMISHAGMDGITAEKTVIWILAVCLVLCLAALVVSIAYFMW